MKTKKKKEISTKELKRKYNNWMKNFVYGIQQMVNEHPSTQTWIFYILLQDCLYNRTTNTFFSQMYKRDKDFYKIDTDGGLEFLTDNLEDYQKGHLDRKRLINGMEDLITGGGRKKFVGVLNQLKQSYENGEY